MVTLEQKLSEFQKIIEEKVDDQNNLLIEEKKAEIEEYLAKVEKELVEQYERNKRQGMERIDKQKQEKISSLVQKERRNQLKLMEDFLQKIKEDIEDRFRDFVLGDDYPAYVAKLLEVTLEKAAVVPEDEIFIRISPQNFDRTAQGIRSMLDSKSFKKYTIEEGEIDYIGGFILEIPGKNLRINKTISMSIDEKRDDIGQYIQSYIQGGGK